MNPVYNVSSVPDPFVLDVDGKHADYWAYQTGDRFPVLHSSDLINWTRAGLAMTVRPSWVVQSGDWHPWAPSVIQTTPPCPGSTTAGCFVMYYVGLSAYGVNCVAVATSPKPGGPYTDRGPLDVAPLDVAPPSRPLGCGDDTAAGNIDPSPFVDTDGRAYLYVSSDFAKSGETRTLQPTVSVIPLAPTLVTAASARVPLFAGSPGTWEAAGVAAPTVEGPTMVKHGGIYYLLYSGGSWQGAYGMGYATSTSATGPFTKAGQILAETADVKSPGGGDTPVIGPGGGTWMAYHGRSGSHDQVRMLRLDRFGWSAGSGGPDVPVISGPTSTPQSAQP
jgi:beta-xylosidase